MRLQYFLFAISVAVISTGVAACGDDGGTPRQSIACPAAAAVTLGAACGEERIVCRAAGVGGECGFDWLICRNGAFTNEATAAELDICGRDAEYRCEIEGTGSCSQEPAGGVCGCNEGTYECSSGCPDGCPGPSAPTPGDACTEPGADVDCRYTGLGTCRCTEGTWQCSVV